ncbi:abc efflux [Moniliophthora roreri MCA 2997]|uniref:Abc efflux n=2 Tax=Moniliophthora roreri TaxID=221103 RepID=V2X7Q1_MONRO|nr:abc efflux [Moniliophthora roreri MCA 2997]
MPSTEEKGKGVANTPAIGVDLDLVDIKVTLKKLDLKGQWNLRPILREVATKFQAGEVNIVVGPSGSGMSSLLNLLSSRLPSSIGYFVKSSKLLVDGIIAQPEDLRGLCSYVTQDDNSLLPYLTVREMFRFATGLRLPKDMTWKAKRGRAEEVIRAMGLGYCADNLIGGEFVKGISGGEK